MHKAKKIAAIIRPGTTPAANRTPTDASVAWAKSTIGAEGGMRIPSVPPPATTPKAPRRE